MSDQFRALIESVNEAIGPSPEEEQRRNLVLESLDGIADADDAKVIATLRRLAEHHGDDAVVKSFMARVTDAVRRFAGSHAAGSVSLDEDMAIVPIQMLVEKMSCDSECRKKFMGEGGKFKGSKGERFENCVKMFSECCSGVDSPKAMCAYIGRRAGKI